MAGLKWWKLKWLLLGLIHTTYDKIRLVTGLIGHRCVGTGLTERLR